MTQRMRLIQQKCASKNFGMDQVGPNAVKDLNNLRKFLDSSYRESYLDAHVKGSIAYQIQAIREKIGLNQTEFGALIGKPQSVVSRLENTEYGAVNINTLLQVANHLGIGLSVRFCGFDSLLAEDVSPNALAVESITETVERLSETATAQPFLLWGASSMAGGVRTSNIQVNEPWQPIQISNQAPRLEVYQGSGTNNFEMSMPTQVSPA
jgi:transcriptional regulator with XRE-family HTH domain